MISSVSWSDILVSPQLAAPKDILLFTQDVLIQPCDIQLENSGKNMKAKGLNEKKF